MRPTRALLLCLPLLAVLGGAASRDALDPIDYHDNAVAAGTDREGVREVSIEIRRGLWLPNGPDRPGTPIMAFGAPGEPLLLPGPMIRVAAGTRLAITVRNGSDSTIVMRGLSPDPTDSLVLAPGASGTVRSVADQPGNHFYYGAFPGRSLADRRLEDAHLAGAIIVDPRGTRPRDEVFVITGSHHSSDSLRRVSNSRELYVLNGRPWPFSRRLQATVGDSSRYRVLNVTRDAHPMHLHGTFFRVASRGGAWRDTVLSPDAERMVATEYMPVGSTMMMTWMPDRPGTWLMHCHLTFHVAGNLGFGADSVSAAEHDALLAHGHGGDPDQHVEESMGGLFMTITVPPPPGWSLPPATRKVISFEVPRDSAAGVLLLHEGEPTTVRVVNNSGDPTAIHWHGMELENLYDGVVGVGGTPGQRTRAVVPGSSFDARMTPPRAGTFIYHTHLMEVRQQESGLYGAMIVLPPGEVWDDAHDHVFILGTRYRGGPMLNGAKVAPTLEWTAGMSHRLRLINVTTASPGARFQLVRADSSLVAWTRQAKDAVDLPASRRMSVPSRQLISMGETYDMLFTATEPAEYRLEIRSGAGVLLAQQPIRVVPRR